METRKIDKLFKNKLAGHTSQPDPGAWAELDRMIDKKNKKAIFWYYKIAASVVMVLMSSILAYILFEQTESNSELTVAETETQVKNVVDEKIEGKEVELLEMTDAPEQITPAPNGESSIAINTDKTFVEEPNNIAIEEEKYLVIIEEETDGKITIDSVVIDLDNMQLASRNENTSPESTFDDDEQAIAFNKKKKPAVRITYKSSPKKVINRRVMIVAKLDTMKRWRPDFRNILKLPGSLLADVRDAKNDLFNQRNDLERSETRNSR